MKSPKQHRRSRRALQDLNNPFTRNTHRNHHPGLDAAFSDANCSMHSHRNKCTTETSTNDDSRGGIMDTTSPEQEQEQEQEQLFDRESSIITSWELDMSIGARAAIYEQTRYIAKYGLDGEGGGDGDSSLNYNNNSISNNNKSSTRDEWDRIMDGSMSHASFSSTFITDHDVSSSSFLHHSSSNHAPFSSSSKAYASRGNVSASILDENQELDMMVDGGGGDNLLNLTIDHSDYFNSSRVANLFTPEKNKSKVDEASRQARLDMLGGGGCGGVGGRGGGASTSFTGKSGTRAITRVPVPFPSIGEMVEDKFHKSCSDSIDGSGLTDSGELGMVGLFNAALRLGEEADDDNSQISKDQDDGHNNLSKESSLRDQDHIQEPENQSFVSYQEPNLSVVHEGFGNYIEEIGDRDDAQESFISYREPDLSLISSGRDHSNRAHSDFDVDVSEIIAPSEIESKIGASISENPYIKSSFIADNLQATPERENHRSRIQFDDSDSTTGRPLSPPRRSHSRKSNGSNMHHSPDAMQDTNLHQNMSIEEDGALIASPNKKLQKETPEASLSKGHQEALEFKANISLLSPIDKERHFQNNFNAQGSSLNDSDGEISFSGGVQNFQPRMTSPQGTSSLSSHSQPPLMKDLSKMPKKDYGGAHYSSISGQKMVECPPSIPRKISLRERYSRSDRFEDSYSSASAYNSSPHISLHNSPINRSLLERFQSGSESPRRQTRNQSFSTRRFEI